MCIFSIIYIIFSVPFIFLPFQWFQFPQYTCHFTSISWVLQHFFCDWSTSLFSHWLFWWISHHLVSINLAFSVCFEVNCYYYLISSLSLLHVVKLLYLNLAGMMATQKKRKIIILQDVDRHMGTVFPWWNNMNLSVLTMIMIVKNCLVVERKSKW